MDYSDMGMEPISKRSRVLPSFDGFSARAVRINRINSISRRKPACSSCRTRTANELVFFRRSLNLKTRAIHIEPPHHDHFAGGEGLHSWRSNCILISHSDVSGWRSLDKNFFLQARQMPCVIQGRLSMISSSRAFSPIPVPVITYEKMCRLR